eukprot:473019_1
MDKERQPLLKGVKIDENSAPIRGNHPLKSTMQWLVEEKGDACDLVYVVDVDRHKSSYNNDSLIVIKSDQSYHRVNISNIKSTQEIRQMDKWKLRQALSFAEEQSRDNAIVPGSLLVEEHHEFYQTSSGWLCLGSKTTHQKRTLKGFKVKKYRWTESNLKGFETEPMNDAHALQFKAVTDTSIVFNEKDPVQKTLRAKQRAIDEQDRIISAREQTIAELQRENDGLKQQLQASQVKSDRQRRNSVHQIQNLQQTIQDSNDSVGSLRSELQFVKEKMQRLHNEHQKLQKTYNENAEELKRVTKQRDKLQGTLIEYSPDVTTLDTDFPPIQDIITKFDQTRGQSRLNCAKVIKKYFKSRNKDLHKLQINKKTNDALFDVLMTCSNNMKSYHTSVFAEYKQTIQISNEKNFKEACFRKVRSEFQTLYDEIETEYLENVLEDIESKYDGVLEYCSTDLWTEYVKECLFICWYLVVCQSPWLELYPLSFGYDDKKSDAFDNSKYVAVYGSEEEEAVNYYVWPTIIRTDNNYPLSKIHALFLNNIPMYSKKGLKRRKAQSETETNSNLKQGI